MSEFTPQDPKQKQAPDEEAIRMSYDAAFEGGFTGTVAEYYELLCSDDEALGWAYEDAQLEGYKDSIDDFKNLLGITEAQQIVEEEIKEEELLKKKDLDLEQNEAYQEALASGFLPEDFGLQSKPQETSADVKKRTRYQEEYYKNVKKANSNELQPVLQSIDLEGNTDYFGTKAFGENKGEIQFDSVDSIQEYRKYQAELVKAHREGANEALTPQQKLMGTLMNSIGDIMTTDDSAKLLYGVIVNDMETVGLATEELEFMDRNRMRVGEFTDKEGNFGLEGDTVLEKSGSFLAAAVDGLAGFAVSAAKSRLSGGVLLATDIVGRSIHDYNRDKATAMGVSTKELYNRGEHEIVLPGVLGVFEYALEKTGLEKVLDKVPFVKKQFLGKLLKSITIEGGTEYVQAIKSQVQQQIAYNEGQGKETLYKVSEVLKKSLNSKESLEALYKGMSGGAGARIIQQGGAAAEARAKERKFIAAIKEEKDFVSQEQSLQNILDLEEVINNKNTSEPVREAAREAIAVEKEKIADIQRKTEEKAEKVTEDERTEIVQLRDEQIALAQALEDVQNSPTISEERKNKIVNSLQEKFKNNVQRVREITKEAENRTTQESKQEVKQEGVQESTQEATQDTQQEAETKKSYDLTNEEDTGVVDQKFDPTVDSDKVTVIDKAKRALTSLKSVLPDVKIVLHEDDDAFVKATGAKQTGRGAYRKSTNTIHVNLDKATGTTVAHETFHALLRNAVNQGKWEGETRTMLDAIRPELAPALQKKLDDFVENYDANVQNEERVAELFGLITESQTKFSPTVTQKIKNWINNVSKAIGLDKIIDDADIQAMEVKELLNTLSGKVESGEAITTKEAAQLNEEVRDKIRRGEDLEQGTVVGDITITDNIPEKDNDIVLQLTERTIDMSSIERGSINDLAGKKVFAMAADRAAVGKVVINGREYNMMGGPLYGYLKQGGWAFTEKGPATRALNKARETDGIAIIMVQGTEGVLGNLTTYNIVVDQFRLAVENGTVKESDLVDFINEKLFAVNSKKDKETGERVPVDSVSKAFMDREGRGPVKSLDDFDKALRDASYDVRNPFMKSLIGGPDSANPQIKKRLGIDFSTKQLIEATTDPAFLELDTGDLVAAIEIDKDGEVIDTRESNDYETHPSYPYIIKGKPLMVFNKPVDVREVFGEYVSQSTGKLLGEQGTKRAGAYFAMKAQPVTEVASGIETEVSDIVMQKVDKELSKNSGSTQVPNTVSTYKKAAERIKSSGMIGSVLDYGAGLGLGTDAMSEVLGTTVSSLEINVDRWRGKQPPTYTNSKDIDTKFDNIVSLNVLNVVPKDVRDGIVDIIASKLNEGGKAYIGVRAYRNDISNVKNFEPGPEPKSVYVNRAGVGRVFQKGWDGNEFVEYITERLGDGYKVEKAKIAATGVIITKGGDLAMQKPLSDSEQSAVDGMDSMYEAGEKYVKQQQKKQSVFYGGAKKFAERLYRDVIDRQVKPRKTFKQTKEGKKFVDAMTTRAGHGALAAFEFEEARKKIFKGLKKAEKKILDKVVAARRVIAINQDRQNRKAKSQQYEVKYGKTLSESKYDTALEGDKDLKFYYTYDNAKERYVLNDVNPYVQINGSFTLDMLSANEAINGFKKSLGSKFDDISKRADMLFEEYKEQLKLLYESGRIGEEEYLYFRDIDYAPIKVLNKIIQDNESLYPEDPYKRAKLLGISENDLKKLTDVNNHPYAMDTEWVLATTMAAVSKKRSTNIMLNKLHDAISADPDRFKAFVRLEPAEGMVPVRFFIKGKPVDMYMAPEMGRQILDIRADSKTLDWFGKISGADLLKFFATGANPAFIITNTAIDIANVAFFSNVYGGRLNIKALALAQLGKDYFKNIIKKAADDMAGVGGYKEAYKDFLLHGGGMDYLTTQGLGNTKKALKDYKGMQLYVDVMSYLGTASEQAVRLSVYQKSLGDLLKQYRKENGLEAKGQELTDIKTKAAAIARNMIDFNQGGNAIKAVDRVVPYLNAATQAARRPMDYLKESPGSFAWSISQAAAMSYGFPYAMKAMLEALFDDDDEDPVEYIRELRKNTSKYERANYHIFPIGDRDAEGNPRYVRIKKLPILGIAMTAAEEISYAQMLGEEIMYDSMMESGMASLPITGGLSGVASRNPAFSAGVAYYANYDLFRRQDIVKKNPNKPMFARDEVDGDTAAVFKLLTQGAAHLGKDVSPKRLQAAFEKMFVGPANNPAVAGMYALGEAGVSFGQTMGIFEKSGLDTAFAKKPLKDFMRNVERKLIRSANPMLNDFASDSELENRLKEINGEQHKRGKAIDALIKKQIEEAGEPVSKINNEVMSFILDNYDDAASAKRAIKKYNIRIRLQSNGVQYNLIRMAQERDPKKQAAYMLNYYKETMTREELIHLQKLHKMVGRRGVSDKALKEYMKLVKK